MIPKIQIYLLKKFEKIYITPAVGLQHPWQTRPGAVVLLTGIEVSHFPVPRTCGSTFIAKIIE